MQAHGGHGQVIFLAELAHLHQVHQVLDVLFHLVQAHQGFQLGHQLVKAGLFLRRCLLLRLGLFAAGSLGPGLVQEAGLAGGDKVQGIQGRLAFPHAGGITDGTELIGALGDEAGLGIGDVVIHGSQVQQNVGGHADEDTGGLTAAAGVALGQVPVKGGRHEHI